MPWLSKTWRWLRSSEGDWLTKPFAAFVFTRILVLIGVYIPTLLGISLFQSADVTSYPPVLEVWNRWDAQWYVQIAEEGYTYVPGTQEYETSTVAFQPLYPLSIAVLRPILGNGLVTGMLISNVAFLLALILLYRFTEEIANPEAAQRTVFYLAVFPSAYIFSVAYTESLFLLLILGCIWFARQRRWMIAVLLAALASATRISGFLIALPLYIEWAMSHGWAPRDAYRPQQWRKLFEILTTQWRQVLLLLFAPAGLIAYMGYLWLRYGDPLAWLDAAKAWGTGMSNPVSVLVTEIVRVAQGIPLGGHALVAIDAFNIALVFAILLTLPAIYRRIGGHYAWYVAINLLFTLTDRTESMNRYILVLFPVFMVWGMWGSNKKLDLSLKVLFIPLLALFSALWVNWVFVG